MWGTMTKSLRRLARLGMFDLEAEVRVGIVETCV